MFSISTESRQWYVLFFVCYRSTASESCPQEFQQLLYFTILFKSLINLPTFLVRIVVRFGGLQNVQNMLFTGTLSINLSLRALNLYIENSAELFFIKNWHDQGEPLKVFFFAFTREKNYILYSYFKYLLNISQKTR